MHPFSTHENIRNIKGWKKGALGANALKLKFGVNTHIFRISAPAQCLDYTIKILFDTCDNFSVLKCGDHNLRQFIIHENIGKRNYSL